jgi:hypothetical protein
MGVGGWKEKQTHNIDFQLFVIQMVKIWIIPHVEMCLFFGNKLYLVQNFWLWVTLYIWYMLWYTYHCLCILLCLTWLHFLLFGNKTFLLCKVSVVAHILQFLSLLRWYCVLYCFRLYNSSTYHQKPLIH